MATLETTKLLLQQVEKGQNRLRDAVQSAQNAALQQQQLGLQAAAQGLVQTPEGVRATQPGDPLFESQQSAQAAQFEQRLGQQEDLFSAGLGQAGRSFNQQRIFARKSFTEDLQRKVQSSAALSTEMDIDPDTGELRVDPDSTTAATAALGITRQELVNKNQALQNQLASNRVDIDKEALRIELNTNKSRLKGIDQQIAFNTQNNALRLRQFGSQVDLETLQNQQLLGLMSPGGSLEKLISGTQQEKLLGHLAFAAKGIDVDALMSKASGQSQRFRDLQEKQFSLRNDATIQSMKSAAIDFGIKEETVDAMIKLAKERAAGAEAQRLQTESETTRFDQITPSAVGTAESRAALAKLAVEDKQISIDLAKATTEDQREAIVERARLLAAQRQALELTTGQRQEQEPLNQRIKALQAEALEIANALAAPKGKLDIATAAKRLEALAEQLRQSRAGFTTRLAGQIADVDLTKARTALAESQIGQAKSIDVKRFIDIAGATFAGFAERDPDTAEKLSDAGLDPGKAPIIGISDVSGFERAIMDLSSGANDKVKIAIKSMLADLKRKVQKNKSKLDNIEDNRTEETLAAIERLNRIIRTGRGAR